MTTVTLPREVVQKALEALEGLFPSKNSPESGVAVWRLGGSYAPSEAIIILRAALDAPQAEPGELFIQGKTLTPEQSARRRWAEAIIRESEK